ncbi:MAG: hypothetical protein H0U29_06565 [Acidimicrobiia bacterium]|nr:hypothetical protein [Acidimicrobiia bacterium]
MSDTPTAPDPSPASTGPEVEVDPMSFLPEATSFEVDGPAGAQGHASDAEPEVGAAERPAVDVAVLTMIEGELAAVDDALAAIDAGDYHCSWLLTELLDRPATAP